MLSNQGQAVNLRDGSPLYPFNFIQHDNLRAYRLAFCRFPGANPLHYILITF